MSKSIPRIEAIHRALQVLKLMASQGSVNVTEVAEHLEVNPSTASRILTTIEADGFAVRGAKRRYFPGTNALHFGRAPEVPALHDRLRPHLERLSSLVHETVHVAKLVGTTVHHSDAIAATDRALVLTSRIGKRLPAHLASSGKAMLADLAPAVVNARYAPTAQGATPQAVAFNLAQLHHELDDIRRQGYAINVEATEKGLVALATSLGHIGGEHVAFSVALPLARYSTVTRQEIADALLTVQHEVREAFSWEDQPPRSDML
ncbi:IclR family transcriptional regulator [Enteractinococcus helveticum]|nr:IclR family transcriptional regulator C-terminal domain-containing protein [Enteractinococcus helveticum]